MTRGQVPQQVVGRDPQTTELRSQSHRPGIDLWDDHQWLAVLQVEIDSNRHSRCFRVAGPCPPPSVNSNSRDAAEDAFFLREADGIHVSLSYDQNSCGEDKRVRELINGTAWRDGPAWRIK